MRPRPIRKVSWDRGVVRHRPASPPLATTCLALLLTVLSINSSFSGEWPAPGGDPDHSGVTDEAIELPLDLAWQYQANHPSRPAFRGGLAPSKKPRRIEPITYDYVFDPVVAGGLVLMPEASSGCTCGFSLQTSVVLAPIPQAARNKSQK